MRIAILAFIVLTSFLGCGREPLPGVEEDASADGVTVTEKSQLIYVDNLSGTYNEWYARPGKPAYGLPAGFNAHLTITNVFAPTGWFSGTITVPPAAPGSPPGIVTVSTTNWWSSSMQFYWFSGAWHFAFCNHGGSHRWNCFMEVQQFDQSYIDDGTLTLY
jgi:hypothetical protein